MKLRCAAAALLVSIGGASLRAAEPEAVDAARLSGVWSGKRSTQEVGNCGMSGGGKNLRVTLDVKSDGSFTATEARAPDYKTVGPPWQGHVAPGGIVDADRSAYAVCKGEKREYRIRLAGKVWTDKARLRLRLEGEDAPCPQYSCYFKLKYTLDRDE